MACRKCGKEGHNARTCGQKTRKKSVNRKITDKVLLQRQEFIAQAEQDKIKKAKVRRERQEYNRVKKEALKNLEESGAGGPEWCEEKIKAIHSDLTPKQVKAIQTKNRRRASLCGRRAGKTWGPACAQLLLTALENEDALCVYITLSRKSARRIIWPMFKKFDRRYGLFLKFNNLELEVTLPNGSQIWVTGATDTNDIEKLRGSAYHIVVVDECASFGGFFDTMIEEVIEPALEDYDGILHLIGTPSAACVGYFHKVTTDEVLSKIWAVDTWTVLDNPMFPRWVDKETGKPYKDWRKRAQKWMENHKKSKGWDNASPTYLREWCGIWVRDEGGLVYVFEVEKNDIKEFLKKDGTLIDGHDWHFVLGVDLGFNDDTAFALTAYSMTLPVVLGLEHSSKPGLITDDIALRIKDYMERFPGLNRIVMDTGGLGKTLAEDLRQRYSLPIFPAQKTAKYSYIKLMNSDLKLGRFKTHKDGPWVEEAQLLQWDESATKEDDRFKNHICDAQLYSWRDALHWQVKIRKKSIEPEEGSKEWQDLQQQQAKKRAIARVQRKLRGKNGLGKPWYPTSTQEVLH